MRDAMMLAINREERDPKTRKLTKRYVIIAEMLARKACKGDLAVAREIWDRVEGKPTQQVDVRRISSVEDLTDDELAALAHSSK